jgi:hypothetical protein
MCCPLFTPYFTTYRLPSTSCVHRACLFLFSTIRNLHILSNIGIFNRIYQLDLFQTSKLLLTLRHLDNTSLPEPHFPYHINMNPSPNDSKNPFKARSQDDWEYVRDGDMSDSSEGNPNPVQRRSNGSQEESSSAHHISQRAGIVISTSQLGRDEPQSAPKVFSWG